LQQFSCFAIDTAKKTLQSPMKSNRFATIKNSITTLRAAHRAGMLHVRVRTRLLLLSMVALLGIGVTVHDIFFRGLNVFIVIAVAFIGMLFGFYVMAHMYNVKWHEQEEVLTLGRIDIVGVLILILYLVVREIAYRSFAHFFTNTYVVSGIVLAFFWGIIIGRLYGIIVRISHLFRTTL